MDRLLNVFIFACLAAIVGVVVLAVRDDAHAEKFSLRKDSWRCTKSHDDVQLIFSGKVMVPITATTCDQWARI